MGCIFGLAIGDAVGTTLEFKERGTFEPITDMVGGGPFYLEPGEWTDDTSMTLCLAQSLIVCAGFDAKDQLDKYVKWYKTGYFSSNDVCFDIGDQTRKILDEYIRTDDEVNSAYVLSARLPNGSLSSGNGSLMRIAPIALYYLSDTKSALKYAMRSSLTTHASVDCIDCCTIFVELLLLALSCIDKATIVNYPRLKIIGANKINSRITDIKSTGYVKDSISAAIWCFNQTENYKDAILLAANLGGDADTIASITGQLAGAYYGFDSIPIEWRNRIAKYELLESIAKQLYHGNKKRVNAKYK
ncbi:MAG: ADP-ribosylglycohydrolase family protein [Flavobacterium sp.]|uniref:ADP-ribosylglycohydrolase family protein n=1 Tax=Flavobacterium sp. TaxID=239 RepID=UPI0026277664|nr:ADP-ribosylglycohydrolase family protein [Flavobacterium sp.]MDD5149807.1 ADP-ribosylglycohydrolase family protein [Flavobacterium sp.]